MQGLADQLTAIEDQDDEELIDWMPGDSGIDFVHDYWTDEAEYRFTVLCDKMLEYLDSCEYFGGRSLSSEIRYFLYTLLPPIEKFLSYGNVHTFYLAYNGSGFTVEKPIETQFPAPYVSLTQSWIGLHWTRLCGGSVQLSKAQNRVLTNFVSGNNGQKLD